MLFREAVILQFFYPLLFHALLLLSAKQYRTTKDKTVGVDFLIFF